MSDKQIQDWREKIRSTYGDESKLYSYLFTTMDNFYYRYLETTTHKNLTTEKLGPHLWGARSTEGSMIDALKLTNRNAKDGIIELAKSVPRSLSPMVLYELLVNVEELTTDHGEIEIVAIIDWGFPDFDIEAKRLKKIVHFKYSDLSQFRKELAQKLEEACEIFL
jgi:hypothetical protein